MMSPARTIRRTGWSVSLSTRSVAGNCRSAGACWQAISDVACGERVDAVALRDWFVGMGSTGGVSMH